MTIQPSHSMGKKGFHWIEGAKINSAAGLNPILSPLPNDPSKKLSHYLPVRFCQWEKDFKIFGLYQYKPKINSN